MDQSGQQTISSSEENKENGIQGGKTRLRSRVWVGVDVTVKGHGS